MTEKSTPRKHEIEGFRSTINLQQKRLFQEISERGNLHHQYLTVLEQQEAILSSLPALIYIRDNHNQIQTANERFCSRFHISASDLPLAVSSDLKADGLETMLEEDEFLLQENRRIVLEERIVNDEKEGRSWFWVSKIPFHSADQKVLGLVCTLFDISGNKQDQMALQESENLFRTLAERSFSGIFISQNSQLKYVNPLFFSLFALDPQARIDQIDFHALFIPEDSTKIQKKFMDIEKKGLFTSRFLLTTKNRESSGSGILEVYLTQIDYQGRPAVLGSLLDITDTFLAQKALEAKAREFEALNQQLEERIERELEKRKQDEQLLIHQSRLAAMGEMIGAIAHHWRQPLTTLSIMIQNLENTYNFAGINEKTLKDFIDTALVHITRMTASINEFSHFFNADDQNTPAPSIFTLLQDSILVFSRTRPDISVRSAITPELNKTKWKGQTNAFKQVMISLLGLTDHPLKLPEGGQREIIFQADKKAERVAIRIVIPQAGATASGGTEAISPHRDITLDMCRKLVSDHMGGYFQVIEKTAVSLEFLIDLPVE